MGSRETSDYWKEGEKQAKKLEKRKKKEEKEKEKRLKHLLEERQKICLGEMPEQFVPLVRKQIDPDWNYEACAREIQQQLAYKLFKQRKHAMKDAERIRKGELPEHFGEVSMKRNYTQDPKFNATCVCDGLPKQTMQGTSSATTGPEYSGGTSGYWKEKQAKKLENLKRKEEKE